MCTREHLIALGSTVLYGVTALLWAAHANTDVGKRMLHDSRMLDLCVYGTVVYTGLVVFLLFCMRIRRREGECARLLRTLALAGVTATATAQPFLLVYLWLALKHASFLLCCE